jgi:glycerophosphoryl diester phosphodiesterase
MSDVQFGFVPIVNQSTTSSMPGLITAVAIWLLSTSIGLRATDAPPNRPARLAAELIRSETPQVIGHRGYSKLAPENTLPSFRRAIGARADLVELDYHHSRDGVPMVSHDANLERTTDAGIRWAGQSLTLGDRTAADLANLEAGRWFDPAFEGTRLPSLREALDLIQPSSTTLIERKGGDPATLIRLLNELGQVERVVVQSFDWEFLRACHQQEPRLVLGALGPPSEFQGRKLAKSEKQLDAKFIKAIRETGAQLAVWNKEVSAEGVALARREGLSVWVYTIDDPVQAADLVELGVRGIITNDPDPIRKALGRSPIESTLAPVERNIPTALPGHPGNIYIEGEPVEIELPKGMSGNPLLWKIRNVDGQVSGMGETSGTNPIVLPNLGIGWYRVEFLDSNLVAAGWTSAAVLARLKAPTPADSPICLDTALSWFARNDTASQTVHANLAALAGANWSRDRLRWGDVQPVADAYAPPGNYDQASDIQHRQGLRVLQVFHDTPRWARGKEDENGRFASDLRIAHRFCRNMGRRFQNQVLAWEPWNEANVESFGGHTLDEIAAWQKAAWLGFHASGAKVIAGYSALAAVPTWRQTESVLLNEIWPYFDTYNIHTYDWANSYDALWEPARIAACGKPLWITEADRGAQHDKKAPWYDLAPKLERLKAEYMAQSYSSALMAGADRFFQFVLGSYQEPNGVQFGLLRLDFTPRPAYAALAAAGRFLAGAKPLGRWQTSPDIYIHAFQAAPDGVASDVLVAWTELCADWDARGKAKAKPAWPAALKPVAVYDFMGRSLGSRWPDEIASAPVFVILPPGHASILPLTLPAPAATPPGPAAASPLVLQALFPKNTRVAIEDKPWSGGYAYRVKTGEKTKFELCFYNFSDAKAGLSVSTNAVPDGWRLSTSRWDFDLAPMERVTATVEITCPEGSAKDGWVVLRGKSATQPDTALAFRVLR